MSASTGTPYLHALFTTAKVVRAMESNFLALKSDIEGVEGSEVDFFAD
jgi:hypothetical protein